MTIQKGLELDVTTDPPPSPEARALGAIGHELDVIGDVLGTISATAAELQRMGEEDAREARDRDDRINRKLDQILEALTDSDRGVIARLDRLEQWRGEHSRDHAAAE